jgi:hypothetical protein
VVALRLSTLEDVRTARECARELAEAAGLRDPGAAGRPTTDGFHDFLEVVEPGLFAAAELLAMARKRSDICRDRQSRQRGLRG